MSIWTVKNNNLNLDFHKGQAKAWLSNRRFIFILAGTQGGKTSFLPWWLAREIQTCGAGDYLAITATYDLFKLKFLPVMRETFENILGIGRYWAGERIIELVNPETGKFEAKRSDDKMWGRIILRSAGSKGGLESATAKAAILDEAGQDEFALEDWEAILRRLSLSQGRVCVGTTPYNLGWLKTEIYDKWTEGDSDIDIFQFSSIENPMFPKAEYYRAKKTMQQWRFDMFYGGQFTRPAGLIYSGFTDDMLVDSFPIPKDWFRVIGLDFGGANTASIHLAQNPDNGIWYAYRETLEGGKTTREHVETQQEYVNGIDHYEFIGGAKSEGQYRDDWYDNGIYVEEPIISDVEAGIDRVSELIATDKFRVFRGLKGLRDEIGGYQRRMDEAGNPVEEILNKRKYHRIDALRYAAILIVEGASVTVGGGRK